MGVPSPLLISGVIFFCHLDAFEYISNVNSNTEKFNGIKSVAEKFGNFAKKSSTDQGNTKKTIMALERVLYALTAKPTTSRISHLFKLSTILISTLCTISGGFWAYRHELYGFASLGSWWQSLKTWLTVNKVKKAVDENSKTLKAHAIKLNEIKTLQMKMQGVQNEHTQSLGDIKGNQEKIKNNQEIMQNTLKNYGEKFQSIDTNLGEQQKTLTAIAQTQAQHTTGINNLSKGQQKSQESLTDLERTMQTVTEVQKEHSTNFETVIKNQEQQGVDLQEHSQAMQKFHETLGGYNTRFTTLEKGQNRLDMTLKNKYEDAKKVVQTAIEAQDKKFENLGTKIDDVQGSVSSLASEAGTMKNDFNESKNNIMISNNNLIGQLVWVKSSLECIPELNSKIEYMHKKLETFMATYSSKDSFDDSKTPSSPLMLNQIERRCTTSAGGE